MPFFVLVKDQFENTKYVQRSIVAKDMYTNTDLYWASDKAQHLIDKVKENNLKLLLLSNAGNGKSWELLYIAYTLISNRDLSYIPIYITLDNFTDTNLEYYISCSTNFSQSQIDNNSNKFLFLLDEFDQAIDKAKAEREINNFVRKYDKSKFIIASRTNIYTNQFPSFTLYFLLPFNYKDIEKYSSFFLKDNCKDFIDLLKAPSLLEYSSIPFFLKCLIDIYIKDNCLPKSQKDVIQRFIDISIDKDIARLRSKYDLEQTYPISQMLKDLKYISLISETLQINSLDVNNFTILFPDNIKRDALSELTILKKEFTGKGSAYQFQHNNYQEYLAAECIANINLNDLLDLVSFTRENKYITALNKLLHFTHLVINNRFKRVRINKLLPTWRNTISYVCLIRDNTDFLQYLLNNDPQYCLFFETESIPLDQRSIIFYKIFNKYYSRKIWIDRQRIDIEKLCSFGKCKKVFSFLVDTLKTSNYYIDKFNIISLLYFFPEYKNNDLKQLLLGFSTDIDENDSVRSISIDALSKLKLIDKTNINELAIITSASSDSVLSSLYSMLKDNNYEEDFIDVLLEGLPRSESSHYISMKYDLRNALKNIKSPNGIKKIIAYYSTDNRYSDHHYTSDDGYFATLIENICSAYLIDDSVYDMMKTFIINIDKQHTTSLLPYIRLFLEKTNTTLRLFKELYCEGYDKTKSILASIATDDCIDYIINEYKQSHLTEQNIIVFLNYLSHKNYDVYKDNADTINQIIGLLPQQETDEHEIQSKTNLKKKISIIFSKDALLNEYKIIFDNEGKNGLNYTEFTKVFHDEKKQGLYNDYVTYLLLNTLRSNKEKRHTLNDIIAAYNKYNYTYFTIGGIYDLFNDNKDIELTPEQIELITSYCLQLINDFTFINAISVNGNETSFTWFALWVWYFYRKYCFALPENILLDMLSFDYYEGNSFVGIDYLIPKLPAIKIRERILLNLSKGIHYKQVLKNHINFCRLNSITDATRYLYTIIAENKDHEVRKLAIDTALELDNNSNNLEGFLNTSDFSLFKDISSVLIEKNSLKCSKKLKDYLYIKNEEFFKFSAELLIVKSNDSTAIKEYIKYIIKNKYTNYNYHNKSPISSINTIKALPQLMSLLKYCYANKITESDYIHRELFTSIIFALNAIALTNYDNCKIVLKTITTFIHKNRNKYATVNFLYFHYDEIESSFFISCNKQMSFNEAKQKVDHYINKDVY